MAESNKNDDPKLCNPFYMIDSIPKFTSDDVSYSSVKWTQDIEDNAEIFGWSQQQKLIIARRCLSGTAELWLKTEKAFRTYDELKTALLKEFPEAVNSKQMHELMSARKKKSNETFYQYMLVMKELGKRAKFPDYVAIQYIVDGITDYESNKLMLYGVTTYAALKEKLALYESFKEKSKSSKQRDKPAVAKNSGESDRDAKSLRCYKCGDKGHTSKLCEKGVKCFRCNEFGHIGANCKTAPEKSSHKHGGANATHRQSLLVTQREPVNGNEVSCICTERVNERATEQLDGSTHPCVTEQCPGGVGRNIAEVLWKLRDGSVRLLTAIGDDSEGRYLLDDVPGLILDGCVVKDGRTPTYAAVLDKAGECRLGLGDMALYNHITKDLVDKYIEVVKQAPMVVLDGNVPQGTMEYVMQVCSHLQKPVFFEPTDTRKAVKPLYTNFLLTYASPNLSELRAMARCKKPELNIDATNELSEIVELAKLVPAVRNFIVTLGSKGVLVVRNTLEDAQYYPAEYISSVVNVSGAGDCFAGGFIHGILSGLEEPLCIAMGFQAAKAALVSKKTVPSILTVNRNLVQARSSTLKYH